MNFDNLITSLKDFKPEKIVFVGIGNEYRKNDSAGLVFLGKLKHKKPFSASNFIYAGSSPENYFDVILSYKPSLVVFIDAIQHDVGSIGIDWVDPEQIESLEISTHAFSFDLIIKYLLSYKQMVIKILGIRIRSAGFGKSISENTLESIDNFFGNI